MRFETARIYMEAKGRPYNYLESSEVAAGGRGMVSSSYLVQWRSLRVRPEREDYVTRSALTTYSLERKRQLVKSVIGTAAMCLARVAFCRS